MKIRMSASEVVRSFSDVVNRVVYRGDEFVVECNGEPACQITPIPPSIRAGFTIADLNELLRSLPAPDAGFWDDVEKAVDTQDNLPGTASPHSSTPAS
jgi:antitoxin (DNA-binding transcriptional repressor) of toxin-antitoxin stability system